MMMGENPNHNQHINEFAQCIEQAIDEIQMYYDCQIKALLDVIEALEQRVASLEQKVSNSEKKNPDMQVELSVTRASLKKVREAIMNVFRM